MKIIVSIDDIFMAIEQELGHSKSDLQSSSRARPLSDARAILILLADTIGLYDVYKMAALLKRDRCTILHLRQAGINLLNTDKFFASKYRAVKGIVEAKGVE